MHIALDPESTADLVDRQRALDREAARAINEAFRLHLAVSRARQEQRRPGYSMPDAGARAGRRSIEKQLGELGHRAKELPGLAHDSALAVTTVSRLLTEYYLRLDELRPRLVALPY
jgi:hypothetical protein